MTYEIVVTVLDERIAELCSKNIEKKTGYNCEIRKKIRRDQMILDVDPQYVMELHEILCSIPFEDATLHDSEPPTTRHPAVESLIEQIEERMEFLERR